MFELIEFTSNPFTLIMEARVLFDAKAMFNKNRQGIHVESASRCFISGRRRHERNASGYAKRIRP
jgi:hypothetical protein